MPHDLPTEMAWFALDRATDIVICLDREWKVVHINQAGLDRLGYRADELIASSILEISPDFPALTELDRLGLKAPCSFRAHMAAKGDRPAIPLDVVLAAIDTESQTYYWVFARDITLRAAVEEALRQSELKFRGAFHDAAVGMAIFSLDGYFLEVNPFLCETLGYSEDEFKGFHFLDITHPDDIESSRLHDSLIREGKVPFAFHEKRYLHKNSTPVWFIASDSLMRDETGQALYVLTHYQNITKRKEVEQALQAGERRFRLFMDNMPGIAFIKDGAGRYVFGNQGLTERVSGAGDRMEGKTDFDLFERDYARRIADRDREILATGQAVELIEQRPGPSGPEEWLISKFPITNADGTGLLAGVGIDISELVQAKRALEEKETQLQTQAANLEQVNTALKVLLDQREQEKVQLEDTMMATLEKLVLPYLQEAAGGGGGDRRKLNIEIAMSNIGNITAPFAGRLTTVMARLSPTELKVADLLRHEKTTYEIAELLTISPHTVARHRESIRRKLGLTHKKVNLKTYLQTIS